MNSAGRKMLMYKRVIGVSDNFWTFVCQGCNAVDGADQGRFET